MKSILGTSPTQGKIVSVTLIYPDSITHGREYWSWLSGKLYRTTDTSNWPTQPVYDEACTKDSSWSSQYGVYEGYNLFPVSMFGINTSGQDYWLSASRSGFSRLTRDSAALSIGFLGRHDEEWLNGNMILREDLQLTGMVVNGVVYGDTNIVNSVETRATMPCVFRLFQNFPNPFNPTTKIQYTIRDRLWTLVKVYDALGRDVATLVNEVKQPGTYTVEFNGTNLASGIYFYRLQAGTLIQTRKMAVVR